MEGLAGGFSPGHLDTILRVSSMAVPLCICVLISFKSTSHPGSAPP